MTKIKKIVSSIPIQTKSALVLVVATFLCKGINIITMPLFTRILTTQEMGIVTTYTSWYAILSAVANLSLDSGSFHIAMEEFKEDRMGYISSIFSLSCLSSFIVGAIFFILKSAISDLLGLDSSLIILMILSFFVFPATNFWLMKQRYEYKYKIIAITTVLSNGVSVIFSAGITFCASKWDGMDLAKVRLFSGNIVLIFTGIFFAYIIIKTGKVLYNKKYWKFVFVVNSPLFIHSLSKHILDVSDKTMISYIVGKQEVGIYGVLYSVSSLSLIIWNAINASLIPYMFEYLRKKENNNSLNKTIVIMLSVYGSTSIILTLAAPEIVKVLATEEYFEAIYLMPPIAAGIFVTALYNIFSNILLYYKATTSIMKATVMVSITNIILNYIFIKQYGYTAASYTTLFSYSLLAFMQYLYMCKITVPPFNIKVIFTISIITICFCLFCNLFYKYNTIRYAIILLLIFTGVVWRKQLLKILKTLKNKKQ